MSMETVRERDRCGYGGGRREDFAVERYVVDVLR